MKKVELLNNETFTIKGALGEVYVFDGESLFVDPVGVFGSRKATVVKSMRTMKGAEDWVRLAGSKFSNVEILDTDALKANFDEVEDMDESLPFHVVSAEDEDGPELDEMQEEMSEEMEEPEVDEDGGMARTQLSQILEDAQELYSMIEGETELEPWVQSKITRAADYMNAIAEYLSHDEDAREMLEDEDEDEGEEGTQESQPEDREDDDEVEEAVKSIVNSVLKGQVKKPDADGDGVPDWADKNPNQPGNPDEERKPVTGKIFKSLHAARQWNKFENPDKDRYYIDIMRKSDTAVKSNTFDRSRSLNAKYIVRDMHDKPDTTKGAYGNRKVTRPNSLPEKSIDAQTREVSALNPPQSVPEDSVGR